MAKAILLGTDKFLFKYRKQYGEKASFAAMQAEIDSYAHLKLPSFHLKNCFYTRRSLEQCTSESVAQFKASIFKGDHLLILAAGLGVDDWAFSHAFRQIVSVDPGEELNEISRYNFVQMQRLNIERITLTAEVFLTTNTRFFDMIYIDPDRRNDDQRQILLRQHQPDIIELLPELKKISDKLLVKCSPLYDYEMAISEVGNISDIYIISYKGEVKEMLLSVDFKHKTIEDYPIHCVELDKDSEMSVLFRHSDRNIPEIAGQISGYFYEAAAGIIKIRKHHHYASIMGLSFIDKSVPFYFSDKMIHPFMGRCLKIIHQMPFKSRSCIEYLAEKKITKANFKARGLKFSTSEAYKILRMKEGGEDYLFIFPYKGKTHIVHCRYQAFTDLM